MATVALQGVWLNAAANPSDWLWLDSATGLQRRDTDTVEFQQLAGGRTRAIVRESNTTTWDITADEATPAEVAWIYAHQSQLLCVRDHRGQKIYGIYPEISETVPIVTPWSGLSITITQVTHSEAV